MDDHGRHGLTIGEAVAYLRRRCRVERLSASMLRYWEREALIAPRRTPGGHRVYCQEDLRRLVVIVTLRARGLLPVGTVRALLQRDSGADAADALAEGRPETGWPLGGEGDPEDEGPARHLMRLLAEVVALGVRPQELAPVQEAVRVVAERQGALLAQLRWRSPRGADGQGDDPVARARRFEELMEPLVLLWYRQHVRRLCG